MPNRLDRSVSASAGMPSAAAAATASSMRTMPSTIEYSLCRRRWTNRARDPDACARCASGEDAIASTDALDGSAATAEADRGSSAFIGYNFTRLPRRFSADLLTLFLWPGYELRASASILSH